MRRLLVLLTLVPALAFAAEAEVKSITASSTQKPDVGVNYEAENMLKPTGYSYWAEGDGSAGLGTRVDVKFPGTLELVGFAIWNGSSADKETWKNSNRIKILEFEFQAGTFGEPVKETVELKDVFGRAEYTFAKAHSADQLKMFIREVFEGEAFNETAISHIQFLTKGGDGRVYAKEAKAASEADGFPASAAIDGLIDTPWCVAEGKGKGETLEITLPEGAKVTSLVGLFGINLGGEWEKNARPAKVQVQIGEKTLDWEPADVQTEQKLDLGGAHSGTIKITLGKVTKGRVYKDACISEIRLISE